MDFAGEVVGRLHQHVAGEVLPLKQLAAQLALNFAQEGVLALKGQRVVDNLVPRDFVQQHHGADHFQVIDAAVEPFGFLLNGQRGDFGLLTREGAQDFAVFVVHESTSVRVFC